MHWFLKFLRNGVAGFLGIYLYNTIGAVFGMSLGLNLINMLVIGVLGLPGFGLLLLLRLFT
ncbi:MAG: pro-sigmaK processing inhibitor BofA family protein [Oscillospiraceae bacterium]|nr:pro-sigmaK processing inhibitor BofA family protein [Oscillospiraceae bacterium]